MYEGLREAYQCIQRICIDPACRFQRKFDMQDLWGYGMGCHLGHTFDDVSSTT